MEKSEGKQNIKDPKSTGISYNPTSKPSDAPRTYAEVVRTSEIRGTNESKVFSKEVKTNGLIKLMRKR